MSFQITTAFVDQFGSTLMHLAQQKGSRLRQFVESESVRGEQAFFDQLGSTEARVRTTRHGDSPLISTPHARRRVTMLDYEWGDMIDDQDKLRTLIDPANGYVQAGMWALGRSIDDVIISAATGTSYTGPKGLTAVPLPATQKIAVTIGGTGGASCGLNVAKLIAAKSLFGKNDVDVEAGNMTFVVSQQQLDDLLAVTEVRSADYNSVKALVRGEVDTYMGFKFVRTQRLVLDSTTDVRSCFCFVKDGIKLGIGADMVSRVAERADKSFNWYAYAKMTLGGTRMEEVKVVEVACDESPAT
jgi:hypothetical protein